ncbi:hypothetical protein J2128_002344 [Methanomicrobium sp. W14]|uniref:type IV pilin n=1 Tax=Methanomicrobium sp. W14 TaxID=2817839 RepID=UPI001AEB44C3|nr:type IV pilin N-terminal domain-containing protein [Methanomicrobium sp. W14]MBP2134378.1 hypothetical protein [Methanomicrobium sp. W14]
MKTNAISDEAVSPVVGVMLMLVVTIIIAAVVSGFASGLAGGTSVAPQASVVATDFDISGVIDATPGNAYGQGLARPDQGLNTAAGVINVVFEHKGGDTLNLDQIEIHLGKQSEPEVSSLVSRTMEPQTGPDMSTSQGNFGTIGDKSLISGYNSGWDKYIESFPDKNEVVVKPGDRFVLHADYGAKDSNGDNLIAWHKQGGAYGFPIKEGDVLTYDIMDKASQKVIASGKITVPQFTVSQS